MRYAVLCSIAMVAVGVLMLCYVGGEVYNGYESIRPLTIGEFIVWSLFLIAGAISFRRIIKVMECRRCYLCGSDLNKH